MIDPVQTMEARRAEAMRTVKAREDGIRANAIKQGRELERTTQALERHKLEAKHEGELQGVTKAHTEEIARLDERWAREERKHAIGNRWRGRFEAAVVVGGLSMIGLALYTNSIIRPTFDAARESRVQDDVLRTLQRPPTTNEPRSESAPNH